MRSHAQASAARPTMLLGRLGLIAMLAVLAAALFVASAQAASIHSYSGEFGTPGGGSGPGDFQQPMGISSDLSNGHLFVVEASGVKVISPEGDLIRSWGGAATPAGYFNGVYAIAVDAANDRVYVTEQWNGVVDVFDRSGAYLEQLSRPGGYNGVAGVAVDTASGNVYVAESAANAIDVFDSTGAFVTSFGEAGSAAGQISNPTRIAVDPVSHDIYVVDSGNSRVERFTASGTYVSTLAGTGGPVSVAVDPANEDVYVGEQVGWRIARYDSSGVRLEQLALHDFYYQSWSGWEAYAHGLVGLTTSPSTHRVYAVDHSGEWWPSTAQVVQVFAPVTVATLTTEGASGVTATGATLEGKINPEGTTVNSEAFEYGLDTNYGGIASGSEYGLTGTSDIPISVQTPAWSPLQPNATYHYRLTADTSVGQVFGGDQTFTTEPAPPTVDGTSAESEPEAATLHAQINPENSATSYYYEYGLTSAYGSSTPAASAGSGFGDVDAATAISGLAPATVYHYRVIADNGIGGPVTGADGTFKTAPATVPTATEVTAISATLNGIVDLEGSGTYLFEYGTDASYGNSTRKYVVEGEGTQTLHAGVKELEPGTTYHFRLVSTVSGNTTMTADGTFTTWPSAAVITGEATDVGTSGATLNGTVDTHGNPGAYRFLVTGVGSSVARETPQQTITSSGPAAVTASIDGLPHGGTYQVVLVATVGGTTTRGDATTFSTQQLDEIAPRPQSAGGSPYGCSDPHLDRPLTKARAGHAYTVTGSDLGVGGSASLDGRRVHPDVWTARAATFVVPAEATGSLTFSLDCGAKSNTVTLRVKPHRAKHKRRRHRKHRHPARPELKPRTQQ